MDGRNTHTSQIMHLRFFMLLFVAKTFALDPIKELADKLLIRHLYDPNYDLNVITGDEVVAADLARFLGILSGYGIPVKTHTAGHLGKRQEIMSEGEICQLYDAYGVGNISSEHKLYRRDELIPNGKRRQTLFIWTQSAESIKTILDIFDSFVKVCTQHTDLGVYDSGNKLFIFADVMQNHTQARLQAFGSANIRQHLRAAFIANVPGRGFRIWNYNFHHLANKRDEILLNPINVIGSDGELFTPMKSFNGHTMKVGIYLAATYAFGTYVSDEEGGTLYERYKDYWGLEYDILLELEKRLDFSSKILNAPYDIWWEIEDDGSHTGAYGMVTSGMVDFFTQMMLSGSDSGQHHVIYDRIVIGFVAPLPKEKVKYLAILSPFETSLWLTIIPSIFVVGVSLSLISRAERIAVPGISIEPLEKVPEAIWFAFRQLVWDSSYIPNVSEKIAIRFALSVCFFYALVIGHSYGGNLVAYLTMPQYTKLIDSWKDVLEGDLRWELLDYGGGAGFVVENATDDPTKIYLGATYIEFTPTPKLDTVFAGESIFIEYASVLEAFVSAGYTRSDGKRLLHVYKEKGLESDTYLTWFFRKQLPEFERIGEVLANMQEAGLVEHWKKKTWRRMKMENFVNTSFVDEPSSSTSPSAMTIEHFYGTMIVWAGLMTAAFVTLGLEIVLGRSKRNLVQEL